MVEFVINGTPVGKKRPRVTRTGTYTPKQTSLQETRVKLLAKEAGLTAPSRGPVKVALSIVYKRPKRMPKDRSWPSCRPDGDNVEKLILDSLNGIAYTDDSQVTDCSWSRRYTVGQEEPHTRVSVTFLRANGARGRYT